MMKTSATTSQRVLMNEDFLPGVIVEVLWDIEEIKREGRRRGERVVKSIWWPAEVTDVKYMEGKCQARLLYEERDGFQQQSGDVWVFPKHVRVVSDENTQLRWRFYESSGNVTNNSETDRDAQTAEIMEVAGYRCNSRRLKALQEEVGQLAAHYEQIERMVLAQNNLFYRLIGTGSAGDRQCAKLFATLRQKLALLMQKPIPPLRVRKENENANSFFDENCAGSLSVDVDCDLELFEAITLVVTSRMTSACFRPTFTEMRYRRSGFDEAEILFASFSELAGVLGISSTSDVLSMVIRERGNRKQHEQGSLDVAVRVVGSCIMDKDEDNSTMALLFCNSVHESFLSGVVDTYVRESREFDFSSRSYRDKLVHRRCTREEVMRSVFAARLRDMTPTAKASAIKELSSEARNFTIRWSKLPRPNSRTWSRHLASSEVVNGILEVEIPFLLFRGPESVEEVMAIATDSFLRGQINDGFDAEADYTAAVRVGTGSVMDIEKLRAIGVPPERHERKE